MSGHTVYILFRVFVEKETMNCLSEECSCYWLCDESSGWDVVRLLTAGRWWTVLMVALVVGHNTVQ